MTAQCEVGKKKQMPTYRLIDSRPSQRQAAMASNRFADSQEDQEAPYCLQTQVAAILRVAMTCASPSLEQVAHQGEIQVVSLCAGMDVAHIVCNALVEVTCQT